MPTTRGVVENLLLGRDAGKVKVIPPTGGSEEFILYDDFEADTIDPTEMVRRNWMIGLLQQAAVHGGEVSIYHPSETDARVDFVELHATKKFPAAGRITDGTVKEIEVRPDKAFVTIFGTTRPSLGSPGERRAEDHEFLLYDNKGAGLVHGEEAHRRSRVVGLLKQALADGLKVSVNHRDEPKGLITRVTLYAKEE